MTEQLPEDIALALEGFKQQAGVASRMLETGERRPLDLTDAHAKLSRRPTATKTVYRYIQEQNVSVPDIDPEALMAWLNARDDLSIYHLKPTPLNIAACRKVAGREVYFVTTFFGDVEACAGMDRSFDEVVLMHHNAHERGQLVECAADHPMHRALLADCLRPDLVSVVYLPD